MRAFYGWTDGLNTTTDLDVPGASNEELVRLAALGGIAAELAGESRRNWPAELQAWADKAAQPPKTLIELLRPMLAAEDDVLATLYNASIAPKHRRRLGTVFTPPALVDHMVNLADAAIAEPAMIIDPGAGVGAFTMAAANNWPSATVVASDINPVTLGLLATRIGLNEKRGATPATRSQRIELALGDFLDRLETIYTHADSGPILMLGNPPYTRAQSLPPETRAKASRSLGELYGNGHANLAIIFQAANWLAMRPQDASCLVLPASFLHTNASAPLREAIWKSNRKVHVQLTPAESTTFKGAAVRAAVLLIGPETKTRPAIKLSSIKLDRERVLDLDSRTQVRSGESPERWFPPAGANAVVANDRVALGDIAKVRRGTATGANETFFLDEPTMSLLPADVVTDGVLSLRGFTGDELTSEAYELCPSPPSKRWLLTIPRERVLEPSIQKYLDAQPIEVKDRYLVRNRSLWYSLDHLPRPSLLVSSLGRSGFRIVSNHLEAVPSNNLLGVDPDDHEACELVAEWLRSPAGQDELCRVARRYPGGSLKLEPGDLRRVRLPRNFVSV